MTPEGRVKEKVKRILREYGVYWHCPVQNGMGSPTLDFICCYFGRYIAIETKAPGGKPTERQLNTMREIRAEPSHGIVVVVDGDDALNVLRSTLEAIRACNT